MTPNTDIVMGIRLTREFPIEDLFRQCIATVSTHTHNYRLILVDDNSDEVGRQVIDEVARQKRDTLLIRTNYQRWFTRTFNIGLRMVRTPQAVLLNCDTVVDTGWLEELYNLKDELQQSGTMVGLVGSDLNGGEPRRYYITQHPGYVTGHAWLVDMGAITAVSCVRGTPGIYLDETSPANIHIRSDVDMCYQLMKLGYACVTSFKSAVGHQGGRTWGHQLHRIPGSLDVVSDQY